MSNSVVPQLHKAERRALSIEPARVLVPTGLFIAVISVAAPNGSYFPSSWGWSSLAFLLAAAIGLVVQTRVSFGALETAYLGAWFVLLAWTAASLLWSPTTTQTMYEIERTLVYVAFALALAVLGRRSVALLLPALLTGIVAVATYGLATRLFPDRVDTFDSYVGYRLSEPLGYWNALSIFAVVGAAVAAGLAARGTSIVLRSLSAASLVLLLPVTLLTFGRGAWIALAAGLAAAITVDPRRLHFVTTLLVVAPWPAIALWRVYDSPSLTTDYSALADASDEGRRLALTIVVLAVASAIATAGFSILSDRVTVGLWVRRAYGAAVALALVAVVAGTITAYGGPAESARRALDSIRVSSPNVRGDQTQRLFSLSSNGRLNFWEVGLKQSGEHPVLGSGAGTYERWWVEHRDVPGKARDAHSLYVEMLAELGPVGLAALLAAILVPVVAAVRARRHPLVAPALAGFVTLALHAGVDWDWEVPAVMIVGLTCAGVLLLVHRGSGARQWTLGPAVRGISLVLIVILAAFSFLTMTGNRYLGQASEAFNRYDLDSAVRDARRAQRWAPWSTEALQSEADALVADGSFAQARARYREALAEEGGNWALWLGLALASQREARRAALERAASLNPLDGQIRQLRELDVRNAASDG
ncbi:MAG: O-antigen ligase family protein [Actinobacteria bacterium]|nr:O-antigen ligase family protein [Actinomycetota bacterium]